MGRCIVTFRIGTKAFSFRVVFVESKVCGLIIASIIIDLTHRRSLVSNAANELRTLCYIVNTS